MTETELNQTPNSARAFGVIRDTSATIEEFLRQYPNWLRPDVPTYCLPPKVIARLQMPLVGHAPILSAESAAVELAFSALCAKAIAMGIWNGSPIGFRLLQPPPAAPTPQSLRRLGISPEQILATVQGVERTATMMDRLKGYVGWLVVDPGFRAARDRLAEQWRLLDSTDRPAFPLRRSIKLQQPEKGMKEAAGVTATFQEALNAFLDHWGLVCLVTWDLPEPQGPLIPALLPPNSAAMPQHGLHIVLPIHFPLTGADSLLFEIQQQQASLGKHAGLDPSVAGLPHHEAYGQMLEVHQLEATIRSRYGRPGQRGGFVSQLEAAIEAGLEIDVASVQRLRKGISACIRGKRGSVRWLKWSRR